mgnify:CR=1 FL=1
MNVDQIAQAMKLNKSVAGRGEDIYRHDPGTDHISILAEIFCIRHYSGIGKRIVAIRESVR